MRLRQRQTAGWLSLVPISCARGILRHLGDVLLRQLYRLMERAYMRRAVTDKRGNEAGRAPPRPTPARAYIH